MAVQNAYWLTELNGLFGKLQFKNILYKFYNIVMYQLFLCKNKMIFH